MLNFSKIKIILIYFSFIAISLFCYSNFSDSEIANKLLQNINLSPYAIEKRFKLRNPIYSETSSYGHMGRQPQKVVKTFFSKYNGNKSIEVELFTWEKLDLVKKLKKMFL